jgi:hypothetical protein
VSAFTLAAIAPKFAADPGEVTLLGEDDANADRAARDAGDRATAEARIERLARILAPGCQEFARALPLAEAALAPVRLDPRRGFPELRQTLAACSGATSAQERG